MSFFMCLSPVTIRTRHNDGITPSEIVTVPCGSCYECQARHSTEWAFRIMDECSNYVDNCFITLTYNNEHLPLLQHPKGKFDFSLYDSDFDMERAFSAFQERERINSTKFYPTLRRSDLQKFLKRLRKALPVKIRFFACGEYGAHGKRPHYHLIVFGWKPDDMTYFKTDGNVKLYRSKFLESVWSVQTSVGSSERVPIGFCSVGDVTLDSAKYCAKYMQKARFDLPYVLPPFIQMSNRPGIGYSAADKVDLVGGKIYHNGYSILIPRYYLKVLERDGVYLDEYKERRQSFGKVCADKVDLAVKRKRWFEIMNKKTLS